MLVEVEEAVRFLASFLVGKIPRRRLNHFLEFLANLLVERLFHTKEEFLYKFIVNVEDVSCEEIVKASAEAQLDESKIRALWPKNLILELKPGGITAVNAETGARKLIYPTRPHPTNQHGPVIASTVPKYSKTTNVVSGEALKNAAITSAHNAKKLLHQRTAMNIVWTNLYDGATCTPGNDTGCGFYAFTTPSIYSYVQLFGYLNSLASWMLARKNISYAGAARQPIPQSISLHLQDDQSWRTGKSVTGVGDCVARLSTSSPAHLIKRNGNSKKRKIIMIL